VLFFIWFHRTKTVKHAFTCDKSRNSTFDCFELIRSNQQMRARLLIESDTDQHRFAAVRSQLSR